MTQNGVQTFKLVANFHLWWISGASTPVFESVEEQGLGGPPIFS